MSSDTPSPYRRKLDLGDRDSIPEPPKPASKPVPAPPVPVVVSPSQSQPLLDAFKEFQDEHNAKVAALVWKKNDEAYIAAMQQPAKYVTNSDFQKLRDMAQSQIKARATVMNQLNASPYLIPKKFKDLLAEEIKSVFGDPTGTFADKNGLL